MVPASDLSALFNWAERNKLALFPIKAWCKQPLGIVGSHTKDCSLRREDWETWWKRENGCNFGMECGPGRAVVPDVDTNDDGRPQFDLFWWDQANKKETFLVRTPSGGFHLHYKIPDGIDDATLGAGDWVDGIEVQIKNEYVVAPWSQTRTAFDPEACDGAYVVVNAPEFLPFAPPELIDHCLRCLGADDSDKTISVEPLDVDGLPIDDDARMQVAKMLDDRLEEVRQALHGEKNKTINNQSFFIGRVVAAGQLDEAIARSLLIEAGLMNGHARHRVLNTVRSGMSAARNKPKALKLSLGKLLSKRYPVTTRIEAVVRVSPLLPDGTPKVPIVERLLGEGCVTILSGGSGSGKTTLGASLMAASTAGLRNFEINKFGIPASDIIMRPATWIFVSYEGGQYIDRHRRAWHIGVGLPELYPERRIVLAPRGQLVFSDSRRNAHINKTHHDQIARALEDARRINPDLPVVLVIDNITAAIENSIDQLQAACFMHFCSDIAATGAAVMAFGHPSKNGEHVVIGSHVYRSLADIVGMLEIIRKDDGGYKQWIDFEAKHRDSPNGRCLEIHSRKLEHPIQGLELDWSGSVKGRERALEDLRTPFIFYFAVKWASERELLAHKVRRIDAVTPKKENTTRVDAPRSDADLLNYNPKPPSVN